MPALDDRFYAQVISLQESADNLQSTAAGTDQRQWMTGDLNTWSGDPLDIAGMTGAFDRSNLNTLYTDALSLTSPGSTGDCMALRLQVEWLATLERAFRMRHTSPIRSAVHAAGRRRGHADAQGAIRAIDRYIQSVNARG